MEMNKQEAIDQVQWWVQRQADAELAVSVAEQQIARLSAYIIDIWANDGD